jgi:hypothetical protein
MRDYSDLSLEFITEGRSIILAKLFGYLQDFLGVVEAISFQSL